MAIACQVRKIGAECITPTYRDLLYNKRRAKVSLWPCVQLARMNRSQWLSWLRFYSLNQNTWEWGERRRATVVGGG